MAPLESTIARFHAFFNEHGYESVVRMDFRTPPSSTATFPFCCAMFYQSFYEGEEAVVHPERQAIQQYCLRRDNAHRVGLSPKHLTHFQMLGIFDFAAASPLPALDSISTFLLSLIPPHLLLAKADVEFARKHGIEVLLREKEIDTLLVERLPWATNVPSRFEGHRLELYYRSPAGLMELWNMSFLHGNGQSLVDSGGCAERLHVAAQGGSSVFDNPELREITAQIYALPQQPKPYFFGHLSAPAALTEQDSCLLADEVRTISAMLGSGLRPSKSLGKRGEHMRSMVRGLLSHALTMGVSPSSIPGLFPQHQDILMREVEVYDRGLRLDDIDALFAGLRGDVTHPSKITKRFRAIAREGREALLAQRQKLIRQTSLQELSLLKAMPIEVLIDWCAESGIPLSFDGEQEFVRRGVHLRYMRQ